MQHRPASSSGAGGRFLFKLLIAGSGGSGKTTLLKRYTTGLFNNATKMTIGVDFSVTNAKLPNGTMVTLQIWDFGGEDRFRSLLPNFCLGAAGCLMLFDPVRPDTFFDLKEWITIVQANTKNIPILLLSSKQDLIEEGHPMTIRMEEIEAFVKTYNIKGYIPVSSKTGTNVIESFQKISENMIESTARATGKPVP